MGLEPQRLKLSVAVFLVRELVVLQNVVHFSEVSEMKSHDGSSSENTLGLVQFLHIGVSHGQRPEKSAKSLDVSTLLQGLTDSRNLGGGEMLLCRYNYL